MFNDFIYLLKEYGIPVSMQYIIDFYDGLEKGIVNDLDDLFLFSRLIKYWNMNRDELMKKLWDTVREQMEAHHGGNK